MLFRCGRDDGVIKHPPSCLNEWTVCLHDDSVLLAIIYDLPLLTEWMKLSRAKKFDMSCGEKPGSSIHNFT